MARLGSMELDENTDLKRTKQTSYGTTDSENNGEVERSLSGKDCPCCRCPNCCEFAGERVGVPAGAGCIPASVVSGIVSVVTCCTFQGGWPVAAPAMICCACGCWCGCIGKQEEKAVIQESIRRAGGNGFVRCFKGFGAGVLFTLGRICESLESASTRPGQAAEALNNNGG